jgi:hypothetical protein
MSKHRPDEKVSPLVWLIPVPFILAAFLPLTIDHPMPTKAERVAAAGSDTVPAASAPTRGAAE